MDFKTVTLIYFSPTGTTAQIIEGISEGIGLSTRRLDVTPPEAADWNYPNIQSDLILLGAPVYGGRVPAESVRRFRRLNGNGEPVVIVVVYGNRAYDDALVELWDLSKEIGFIPIAAGAFIGEHSFHSRNSPIAPGRPDADDDKKAKAFGRLIGKRLTSLSAAEYGARLHIPGKRPYREWKPPKDVCPTTSVSMCTLCNTCRRVCPTGAITIDERVITDPAQCIQCTACVKYCPEGARKWRSEWVEKTALWLSTHHRKRKEPELFV